MPENPFDLLDDFLVLYILYLSGGWRLLASTRLVCRRFVLLGHRKLLPTVYSLFGSGITRNMLIETAVHTDNAALIKRMVRDGYSFRPGDIEQSIRLNNSRLILYGLRREATHYIDQPRSNDGFLYYAIRASILGSKDSFEAILALFASLLSYEKFLEEIYLRLPAMMGGHKALKCRESFTTFANTVTGRSIVRDRVRHPSVGAVKPIRSFYQFTFPHVDLMYKLHNIFDVSCPCTPAIATDFACSESDELFWCGAEIFKRRGYLLSMLEVKKPEGWRYRACALTLKYSQGQGVVRVAFCSIFRGDAVNDMRRVISEFMWGDYIFKLASEYRAQKCLAALVDIYIGNDPRSAEYMKYYFVPPWRRPGPPLSTMREYLSIIFTIISTMWTTYCSAVSLLMKTPLYWIITMNIIDLLCVLALWHRLMEIAHRVGKKNESINR